MLAETLVKHRRKKILLIAHSMGSIIAWDVLTKMVPQIKIHTLVTIGSPLGNPVVRSRILSDIK
jgi:triacylglycerol esterase/lipase EstA (alpha/beta hydrolase family)